MATPTLAQVDPNSGIDFVRVGAAGNAAWAGNGTPGDGAVGRGSVNYQYSIGKYEVTSGQWAEFFNAAANCPDGTVPYVPFRTITGNPQLPVGGISWRTAAVYCNWLCNNKGTNLSSFTNGAYDVSTFGSYLGGSRFTDQLTHTPGAQYWIPTWDEWLKAAHYDPAKVNSDGTTGGWWQYSNGSDSPWIGGPPGAIVNGQPATANFGWNSTTFPGQNPFAVPLGAYPTTNPWGLYDVAGGTSEWTEETHYAVLTDLYPHDREYDGSWWAGSLERTDRIGVFGGGDSPNAGLSSVGLRIASSVPSPSAFFLGVSMFGLTTLRRRRTHEEVVRDGVGSDAPRNTGECSDPVHH